MKTLNQFKQENQINTIDLLQGKGRAYATVNDKQLVVSSKCDMSKPLFVIPMKADKDGVATPNTYLLCNSDVKVLASI